MSHHEAEQAIALGKLLVMLLKPTSVIDLGCGPGIYLTAMQPSVKRVLGVDVTAEAGKALKPDEYVTADLSKPWVPPFKADLALCLEVGQQLPPERHWQLVRNCASSSDQVFFSSGRPGQGGIEVLGNRQKDEWLEFFGMEGFVAHPLEATISLALEQGSEYSHCGWLQTNSMLLKRAAWSRT